MFATVTLAALAAPQLAWGQAPGSLTQLASPNSCIGLVGSECPTATGTGLQGSEDVAVSPDGKNVYVVGSNDDAIAEFTRGADGSLAEIGCIADPSNDGTSTCTTAGPGAHGLVSPQAIVVSPDGASVYVAARELNGNGTIAEFSRGADGSLTPLAGHGCIAEASGSSTQCDDPNRGHGIASAGALAISPDGKNVYVADQGREDIATFTRAGDGSLSQPNGAGDCIQDVKAGTSECNSTATGLVEPTGVAVSPDGKNVYTSGWDNASGERGAIAEFSRGAGGSLSQPNGSACVQTHGDSLGCATTAIGMEGIAGLVVSPDGGNVYVASEVFGGPIAEFSRDATGALAQLPAPHDCIQEGGNFGCGTTGTGVGSGFKLVVSPDGASVYAAAPGANCAASSCSDVAEFARDTDGNANGSLTQLASPDSCIQESAVGGSECPGNENGLGLGGPGVAISPDGASVYVTGSSAISEFSRVPVDHALTVSVAGSGSGAVSDETGMIHCPSACSHAYPANAQVTLSASPSSGSTFAGWSGACSGTGSCQVTMSSDKTVTATFSTVPVSSTPGAPAPVITGTPAAVTDSGAGFSGSVNPEGLPTTVFFQYGLDKRYRQVGASGPNYTAQTPAQSVGSDFADHTVGPVTLAGLVPNALYHLRLVATNSAGTALGQDVTFTTALAPVPAPPTLGQSFNVAPVSGLVLVLVHGHLVPITQLQQLPAGVTIDSLHGTFQLTTAAGGGGTAHDAAAKGKRANTQTGKFGGAVVRLHQARSGLTTVMMVESAFKGAPSQAICKAPATDARAAASKTIQLLHASAHGKFRTSGRYSAATVRGHSLDDDRPLRRHPHARHNGQRRGERFRPSQDDRAPRRPELPRAGTAEALGLSHGSSSNAGAFVGRTTRLYRPSNPGGGPVTGGRSRRSRRN